jgi:hypothetical protein
MRMGKKMAIIPEKAEYRVVKEEIIKERLF